MATTIANLSRVTVAGYDPSKPTFTDVINFDLKADYDSAGLLTFTTAVQAAIGKGKTVVGVFGVDTKGYTPYYDATADTLFFFYGAYTGGDGPLIVVPTSDLSAVTSIRLGVISQ